MSFFQPADRLSLIPPYLFKAIDEKKEEVRAKGVDIIDLGVGDPDLPTPQFIIDKMKEAVQDPATHRYPMYSGLSKFRVPVKRVSNVRPWRLRCNVIIDSLASAFLF